MPSRLLKELVNELRANSFAIDFVNLGGGLGVPYRSDEPAPPLPEEYGKLVRDTVGDLGCKLLFEPGRLIAANAGILVSRVLYVKHGEPKTFTIVDAAMNDLIRPTLYDAYHEIWPVTEPVAGRTHAHERRGRSGVRDRRLPCPSAHITGTSSWRSHCRDDGRSLWRRARLTV